ncbi:hypothetical protein [Paenibacillus pinihumi]|uniref:hypothetical protein n=1 Tax=Paenibacillus pinihumi TaxID=669462 RepID=UPI000421E8A1|nr:hypothetical protein [Paenibacillus pinihumi]
MMKLSNYYKTLLKWLVTLPLIVMVALDGHGGGAKAAVPANPVSEQNVVYSGKGAVVGLADGHTVEIKWDGRGATAFQFGPELFDAIEAMPEHTRARFEYTIEPIEGDDEVVQLILVSIVEEKKTKPIK